MKRKMFLQIVYLVTTCIACNAQSEKVPIDSIYQGIKKDLQNNIHSELYEGEFSYVENSGDYYLAVFSAKDTATSIKYLNYGTVGTKDTILLGNNVIQLENHYNPLSMQVYRLAYGNRDFIVFTGKSQSASGSGVQVTFYTLCELNKSGKVLNQSGFQSRFGTISNIIDFNNDGLLDYIKIVNSKDVLGEYLLTVNSIKDETQINDGEMILKYHLKDQFTVTKDNLQAKR